MSDTVLSPTLPPPTHFPQDGKCPHCAANGKKATDNPRVRLCDGCGSPIPVYKGMGGNGYESASVHHFHMTDMGSQIGRAPQMQELCYDCYVKDYAKVFGTSPGLLPLSELLPNDG